MFNQEKAYSRLENQRRYWGEAFDGAEGRARVVLGPGGGGGGGLYIRVVMLALHSDCTFVIEFINYYIGAQLLSLSYQHII